MKELIAMLNTFVLLSATVTSVVSCTEEDGKSSKHLKKHAKKYSEDNEENEDNDKNEEDNNEQDLESIMDKIKNNLTIANIKANDTNTVLDLTNEVKSRIEELIQDKSVSYQLTINNNEQSVSKLEEKSYQFNIELKNIAAQEDDEDSNNNSLSDTFSIVVKKTNNNLEEQQIMQQLEQLDQQIEVKLLKKVLIADGINTYKSEKEKIKNELNELALTSNAILKVEFINSIFKEDSELIYKSENPFTIKIDLIAQENNQLSLSKEYKIAMIEGFTKEDLEEKKNKDLQYDTIRTIIRNMFANETVTDKISELVNIKANSEHTVKDVITALNNLDNVAVFDKNQDINKYKFQYTTSLDNNDKLIANKNLAIDVYAFNENDNQPFFNIQFDFKVLGENDLEQYERITEKIKEYLNNKELDLSEFEELNADGNDQWNQTLNKIVKSSKIYNYFNFKPLGSDFASVYANIVDFDLSLDNQEEVDMDNNYFTFNSEEKYVAVNLKVYKKGSTDSNYKIKNVVLKIKVGGLTEQVIWSSKQEKVKQIFNEHVKDKILSLNATKIENFLESYSSSDWTWSNLLLYMKNHFFTFLNLDEYNIKKEEITNYVDIDFLSIFDADKKENLNLNNAVFESINNSKNNEVKIKITPKQKHKLVSESEWNVSYYQALYNLRRVIEYPDYFKKLFIKNQDIFNKEKIVFKQISDVTPLKIKDLSVFLNDKLTSFFKTNSYYSEVLNYFNFWIGNIMIKDNEDQVVNLETVLKTGTYYFYINFKNKKYDNGYISTSLIKINVEVK